MATDTNRNLLFGILALQMDFINREQLLAATSAWLSERTRPLEEILLEQNALTEADRQLLAPLVARHIENHDDDAEKSLAAISSIGSVADELNLLGDPEIDVTVSFVGRDNRQGVESVPRKLDGGSRFRILRPHAKGGLGEVSVAEDIELSREVDRLIPALQTTSVGTSDETRRQIVSTANRMRAGGFPAPSRMGMRQQTSSRVAEIGGSSIARSTIASIPAFRTVERFRASSALPIQSWAAISRIRYRASSDHSADRDFSASLTLDCNDLSFLRSPGNRCSSISLIACSASSSSVRQRLVNSSWPPDLMFSRKRVCRPVNRSISLTASEMSCRLASNC